MVAEGRLVEVLTRRYFAVAGTTIVALAVLGSVSRVSDELPASAALGALMGVVGIAVGTCAFAIARRCRRCWGARVVSALVSGIVAGGLGFLLWTNVLWRMFAVFRAGPMIGDTGPYTALYCLAMAVLAVYSAAASAIVGVIFGAGAAQSWGSKPQAMSKAS
jgi:hypothetical protein